MRGEILSRLSLGSCFVGLGLQLFGGAFFGMDLLTALCLAGGAGAAGTAYARCGSRFERRVAILGVGLNIAALLLFAINPS
jgi:hypothetical protein